MNRELIIALLNNVSLMLALNIVYSFLPNTKSSNRFNPITQGIIAGTICLIIMLNPIQLAPGVILDTRSIVITLTGAFLGGVPVLVAMLMAAFLRIYQGGGGAFTGVMVIACSGILGLMFNYYRMDYLKQNYRCRIVELYILGVVVHIIMLLCFFMIQGDALNILKEIYLPVLLLYPMGTVLLGLLFFKQQDNLSKSLKLAETEEELRRTLMAIGESEARLNRSQSIAHVGSWELELKTQQIWASKEAFAIYETVQDSSYIDHDKIKKLTSKQNRTKLDLALKGLIENDDNYDVEFTITTTSGKTKVINSKAYLERDIQNNPTKVIGIIQDITSLKSKEQELVHINYHDHLTGLYNRRFFEEELNRLDVSRNYPLTIIIGDANGLKLINDSLGSDKGDEMLIKIADSLTSCCRNDEIIARLGGDEFAVLLPHTTPKEAENIINRVDSCMKNETIGKIDLSVSFGYSTKQDSSINIDRIFKEAEDNMYKIKMAEAPSRRSRTIEAFQTTLFEKDVKSEEHSERVSEYATKLAKAYKMNAAAVAEIKTASLLHDIGKIMTPDEVLNKSGVLDRNEWLEIKKHPTSGYRILSSLSGMEKIAEYILNHHERIDGKGYPAGLTGESISIQSKIIAIADSYDAMSSVRSYKNALTKEEIIDELKNNSGTQFDAVLVEIFIREILLKENNAQG